MSISMYKKIRMLLLMESPVGFALFKLLDKEKLFQAEDLSNEFITPDSANQIVKLKAFSKFGNVSEALSSATSLIDGEPSEALSAFLLEHFNGQLLGVSDLNLGRTISRNLSIKCVYNTPVLELMRGLRTQLAHLISAADLVPMTLGLSHGLSRHKLKFSPEKIYNPADDSDIGSTEVSRKKDEVPTAEEKPSKRKKKVNAEETARPNENEKKDKEAVG